MAGGVRAVLGKNVAHRRRGERACEDFGDAVDLVAGFPGRRRRPHHVIWTPRRPVGRAARSSRRSVRELPLAVPGTTAAPLAGARSGLAGAADRPGPMRASERRARSTCRATDAARSPRFVPGPLNEIPDTLCSVPVTRCRCKRSMHVQECTCRWSCTCNPTPGSDDRHQHPLTTLTTARRRPTYSCEMSDQLPEERALDIDALTAATRPDAREPGAPAETLSRRLRLPAPTPHPTRSKMAR